MHYLHFEKGYFQNFFRYFYFEMRVMFFKKHVHQMLLKVKNVKVQPPAMLRRRFVFLRRILVAMSGNIALVHRHDATFSAKTGMAKSAFI